MKKIERRVSALIAAALTGVITLLGYTKCKTQKQIDDNGPVPVNIDRPIRVMYGVPANAYKVQGEVKGPDGKPAQAVIVVSDSNGNLLESVNTNPDGTYFTKYMRLPGDLTVVVQPEEMSLEADTVVVSSKKLMSNSRTEVNFKLKKRK